MRAIRTTAGTDVDSRGPGIGVRRLAGRVHPHELPRDHHGGGAADVVNNAVEAATEVYVEFADGDRVGAEIVGWDLFYDVGLLKVRPGRARSRRRAAR